MASPESEFTRGLRLVSAGDLPGAEAAFAAADRDGHPTAAAAVGLFAESRGERRQAVDANGRAEERGDYFGAVRLGLLLAADDRWADAEAIWTRAGEREHGVEPLELEALLFGGDRSAVPLPSGRARSPFTQPVLVGAVVVLVTLLAVFLAFTANVGLPFVPTRQLRVDLTDGSDLVAGNDVDEGGNRIGFVSSMRPIVLPNGVPGAQLTLSLSVHDGYVPVDSTATVLSRTALGLKYVSLTLGRSHQDFPDGGVMPVGQTSVPVRIDQVFDGYTPPTRTAIQQNLVGFGDALAGRGSALNDTIAALPSLLGRLRPVARYLAAPSTELTRFLGALNAFTSAVSPVAQTNVELFADMATTFQAISASPADLEQTIAQSPSTLDVATRSLAAQQPFLENLTALGNALAPATQDLREALPVVNPAIEVGTRTLARTPSLDAKLQQVMAALKTLAQAPGTGVALNALTATVDTLNPMIKYLGPFVTVCNDWTTWWTNLAGDIDEQTSFGYAQRALFMQGNPAQANNVASAGATAPADGGGATDLPLLGGDEYDHSPNYGAAVDTAGNADCETGQRGYPLKLNPLDPQGRDFDVDPNTPGDQGPSFSGLSRVPPGETFTREPTTGPSLP
jgi:virulence factor Mce-like protein